ncbi:hypothetical protein NDU88_004335 [Pleurodeles waltl]|uniref:Uncharacterized protein n=1 Tax=Pleurodeles waltl TaxID=8319 RepID=A0AAV7PFP7_PLEWA|nr:hypothetical protein NDU88_004335 [Pleurodeles waltl]
MTKRVNLQRGHTKQRNKRTGDTKLQTEHGILNQIVLNLHLNRLSKEWRAPRVRQNWDGRAGVQRPATDNDGADNGRGIGIFPGCRGGQTDNAAANAWARDLEGHDKSRQGTGAEAFQHGPSSCTSIYAAEKSRENFQCNNLFTSLDFTKDQDKLLSSLNTTLTVVTNTLTWQPNKPEIEMDIIQAIALAIAKM